MGNTPYHAAFTTINSSGSSSWSVAVSTSSILGDGLLAVVHASTNPGITSITDGHNTYTLVASVTSRSGVYTWIYKAAPPTTVVTVTTDTFTVNWTAAAGVGSCWLIGVPMCEAVDKSTTANGSSTTPTLTTTPTLVGESVIVAATWANGGGGGTGPTGGSPTFAAVANGHSTSSVWARCSATNWVNSGAQAPAYAITSAAWSMVIVAMLNTALPVSLVSIGSYSPTVKNDTSLLASGVDVAANPVGNGRGLNASAVNIASYTLAETISRELLASAVGIAANPVANGRGLEKAAVDVGSYVLGNDRGLNAAGVNITAYSPALGIGLELAQVVVTGYVVHPEQPTIVNLTFAHIDITAYSPFAALGQTVHLDLSQVDVAPKRPIPDVTVPLPVA